MAKKKTKYKYIEFTQDEDESLFCDYEPVPWLCHNRQKTLLGRMVYLPTWKEWEFQPEPNMGFTIVCNDDIGHFMRQLNKEATDG